MPERHNTSAGAPVREENAARIVGGLQRAHMIALAVIVVAAAPFLWRATQGARLPSAETKQIASEVGDEPAAVRHGTPAEAPAYASLDEDLPPPRATMDATRRAIDDAVAVHRQSGFLGWLAAVQDCYAGLEAAALEQRVYCLQLDAAVYAMERAAPEAFQAADAAINPYFTRDVFIERQMRFAPPNNPALSAEALQRRKGDVLAVLTTMLNSAGESGLDEEGAAPQAN